MPFPDPSEPRPEEQRELGQLPDCKDSPRNFYQGPAKAYGEVQAEVDANGNAVPLTAQELRALKAQAEANAKAKAEAEAKTAAAYKCPRRCGGTLGVGKDGAVIPILGDVGSSNVPYIHKTAYDLTWLKKILMPIQPGLAQAIPKRAIVQHWRIDAEAKWSVFIYCGKAG